MSDTKEKNIYFIDKLISYAFDSDSDVNLDDINCELKEIEHLIDDEFKNGFENKINEINIYPEKCSKEKAIQYILKGDFPKSVEMYSKLYKQDKNNIEIIRHLSNSLLFLNKPEPVYKYLLDVLINHSDNDFEVLQTVANTYFLIPECFDKAIPYFEKIIETNTPNAFVYYQLAFLYERVYQNKKLDKQIVYAKKALELDSKSNLIMAFLAKLHYRNGNKKEAKRLFETMMNNNPTPEEIVLYSRMFLKEGDLKKGYDLYRIRFKTANVAYPKDLIESKRWNGKDDISNSTVIVHYEQGFGDTIMFVRYIPRLAKLAKKIIFVVQKNIIPILKSSGFEKYCTILSHEADVNPKIELEQNNSSIMYTTSSGMSMIEHDYHIPLMDLPYLFDESPDKMYGSEGYLKVDEEKLEKFRKKYIKNNKKIKVGLSYHGTKQSNATNRDIKVKEFLPLFKLKNVEFYSFQADEHAEELKDLPSDIKVYNLGKDFKDFEDTACAMKCMDIVISTDNVVMNLAGALGVKVFALFNVFSESRWYKTEGEDIGWYKTVKPFRAENFNEWTPVFDKIKNEIFNLR